MILDRCEKLQGRIAEKKQLDQSVKQMLRFRKVRDLLAQQRERLTGAQTAWRTLCGAGVFKGDVPAEIVAALAAVESAREGFGTRADSVIDERSFSLVNLGQSLSAAAEALETLLGDAWQRYVTGKVPSTSREVLDALQSAFPSEVRSIRQAGERLERHRQILPTSKEQVQEFENEVLALQQAWDRLGGGGVPRPVLTFLKSAAGHGGAGLELLTDEVRRWLTEHEVIRSFRVRVTAQSQ